MPRASNFGTMGRLFGCTIRILVVGRVFGCCWGGSVTQFLAFGHIATCDGFLLWMLLGGGHIASLVPQELYKEKTNIPFLSKVGLGKCPANRNVLRYVQILARWVFVVDVTKGVEA